MKILNGRGDTIDTTVRSMLRTMADQVEHPNLNDKVPERVEARQKIAESLRKLSNGRYANRLLYYGE